jgi:carbon monoxide dehydrogenase subunit G
MEFSGEFTVDGTPEELWEYVTDPDILMDCAPGCNKMVLQSPSHIVAGLTVGVGSVKPSFDVTGIVTECDRPNRVAIQATGEASRNSFTVERLNSVFICVTDGICDSRLR